MSNSSVDELCRSYLDLKYHFDPASASSAGLVSADSRLGRFDVETTREHLSALRSVSGAIEELETDDLQAEIDEAFDCIDREARLSPVGRAFVERMHVLRDVVAARWQQLRDSLECGRNARLAGLLSPRLPASRSNLRVRP